MKYILSTIGKEINFNLNASRHLIIGIENPTQVSDEEYLVLNDRLGGQLKLVSLSENVPGDKETSTVTDQVKPEIVEPEVAQGESTAVADSAEDSNPPSLDDIDPEIV